MALREAYKNARQNKLFIWITIVFVIFLVLIALFLSYLVFTYPVNQVSQYGITNATEKANLINQYRTTSIQFIATLAQILGGVAVGIGIYFAWENLTTARESQITERFTRAVDQLGAIDQSGNPAIEIRLGGIYALERIANESEKDYWPIMEILTAYVRMNSRIENMPTDTQSSESMTKGISETEIRRLSVDIQTVLTVLGRRRYTYNSGEFKNLDLTNTCLDKAELEGAHFEEAYINWAHLKGATLDRAHFEGTCFVDANLDFAWLESTHLERADIRGASITRAELTGAYLLDAHLEGTSLENAFLENAHLNRANLTLTCLKDAYLPRTDLREANLMGADLRGAWLEDADFRGANLEEANLKGAKSLTIDQLSRVKTLYNAELDKELEIQLREKHPLLFEKPDK